MKGFFIFAILFFLVIIGGTFIGEKRQEAEFVKLCSENNGTSTYNSEGMNCDFIINENASYLYSLNCGDYYFRIYSNKNYEDVNLGWKFNMRCIYTKEVLK